jgi:hypothetical protein
MVTARAGGSPRYLPTVQQSTRPARPMPAKQWTQTGAPRSIESITVVINLSKDSTLLGIPKSVIG